MLVTVAAAACQGLGLSQTPFMATGSSISASESEIRFRVVELGRLFSTEIERAADSIRAMTREPSIRRHALLWKMYAIPAAHEAVLLPDPALSILDAWAFAMQMEEYFERGAGQNVFGPHQSVAVDAARRLDEAARDQAILASDSTRNLQLLRDTLNTFVELYPILGPQFGRTSIALESADLLGTDAASAVDAVGDMNRAVGEMTNRLTFHNEYLLKQASWAALELLESLVQDTSVTATLASATEAWETASALAEELPSLVASERATVMEALHSELAVLIEAIDVQRGAILTVFSAELTALVDAFRAERIIIIEAITAERVATIEAIVPLIRAAMAATGLFVALLVGAVVFARRRDRDSAGA